MTPKLNLLGLELPLNGASAGLESHQKLFALSFQKVIRDLSNQGLKITTDFGRKPFNLKSVQNHVTLQSQAFSSGMEVLQI